MLKPNLLLPLLLLMMVKMKAASVLFSLKTFDTETSFNHAKTSCQTPKKVSKLSTQQQW